MTTPLPMASSGRDKRKLGEQLAEVKRELAMRRTAYPKFIQAGKLEPKRAAYQTECLEDALTSLCWLSDNRAACLAWMAARAGADSVTGELPHPALVATP